MAGPPAVHRYRTNMAGRVQALALPGFGDVRSRIVTALLGKQCGVRPTGWQAAAGDHGGHRPVADVVDQESLPKVRDTERAAKAARA